MDLKEIGTRNWIDSVRDRDCWRALVNANPGFISYEISQLE
jgi:hypothetical protein